jgi:hypothetical protein
MPVKKASKNEQGLYDTKALSEAQFIATFNRIKVEQNEKRRSAKKTLKPRGLTRRTTQDLARLGQKADGTPFTANDLKRFESMSKKFSKRRGTTQGITYLEVVARGRSIDVKRANNNVSDGSGISRASLIALRGGNVAHIRVKASSKSKHQEHMVRVRFEEWDGAMRNAGGHGKDNDAGFLAAAKHACRGRVSFDCDCGRYQFWYRYLATLGNYQLSPPKEFAYTKIRNPNLVGVACKHITKALTMLQSPTWQKPLSVQMERQATRNGFGDDHRGNTYFDKDEQKAANKNRKLTVNQDKARDEYRKYITRMGALQKKLRENPEANKAMRDQLKKVKSERAKLSKENQVLKVRNEQLERQARDAMKVRLSSFVDGAKMAGLGEDKAIKAFAEMNKLSPAAIKKLRGN